MRNKHTFTHSFRQLVNTENRLSLRSTAVSSLYIFLLLLSLWKHFNHSLTKINRLENSSAGLRERTGTWFQARKPTSSRACQFEGKSNKLFDQTTVVVRRRNCQWFFFERCRFSTHGRAVTRLSTSKRAKKELLVSNDKRLLAVSYLVAISACNFCTEKSSMGIVISVEALLSANRDHNAQSAVFNSLEQKLTPINS